MAGPVGAGKTRLALRLAHQYVDAGACADGVVLVELASISDPRLVVEAIAASVGVSQPIGQSMVESLVRRLRSKQLLLVLDTCEHLIEACAAVADQVLRGCPDLRLLATSREPLQVTVTAGEIDALEVLARLVARSMVHTDLHPDSGMQYRLLEPLRQFAWARLAQAGELETTQHLHAAHILTFAVRFDGADRLDTAA